MGEPFTIPQPEAERKLLGEGGLLPLAHAAALRGAADDFLNAMSGNRPAEPPTVFYVQFSNDASAIRRWSLEDFDGAMRVVASPQPTQSEQGDEG